MWKIILKIILANKGLTAPEGMHMHYMYHILAPYTPTALHVQFLDLDHLMMRDGVIILLISQDLLLRIVCAGKDTQLLPHQIDHTANNTILLKEPHC